MLLFQGLHCTIIMIDIEKVVMTELSTGYEGICTLCQGGKEMECCTPLNSHSNDDITQFSKIFKAPTSQNIQIVRLSRSVTLADIRKQKLSLMPGFRVTWYYSRMELTPLPQCDKADITKAFIRNDSNEFTYFICSKQHTGH